MAADEPSPDTSGGGDTGTDTDGSGGADHGAVDDGSSSPDPPTAGGDDGKAPDEDSHRWRRRLLLLVLVLILVLVGGGVGTFVLDGGIGGTGTPTATAQPQFEPGAPTTQSPAQPTPTPVTPGPAGELALEFLGSDTFVEAGGVRPGQAGNATRVVVNNGSMTGRLAVADLNRTDRENRVISPETEVDTTTATGELSAHLDVSLAIVYPDGETVTVFGDEDGLVALADVEPANRTIGQALEPGERARIQFAWRVSPDAGNEIQSDSTTFDVVFQLRAPEPTASS